jgi:hypothetical protein
MSSQQIYDIHLGRLIVNKYNYSILNKNSNLLSSYEQKNIKKPKKINKFMLTILEKV